MKVESWSRLLTASMVAMFLSTVLGAQAVSSVLSKAAPSFAVSVFPANGAAREQLAAQTFTAKISGPDNSSQAARGTVDAALAAVRTEPLAPKAYAIIALAAPDQDSRRAILNAASRINRRDLSLQGLILQEHVAERNYPLTMQTLDQILRVNPERSQEFFPLLAEALGKQETIPLFAAMINGSSPWHDKFLNFAVRQTDALPNLAVLRQSIDLDDKKFDRGLIAGLAAQGDIEGAEDLYRRVSGSQARFANYGTLDWQSAYPPFEWQLVDQAGLRAQQSAGGKHLELSVRPGKGGIIAVRLLNAPETPFVIRTRQRITPVDQLRDVRLQLICASSKDPFYDERFSREGSGFEIETLPKDCAYLVIAISARAWSGRSALSGTIDRIELVPVRTGQ